MRLFKKKKPEKKFDALADEVADFLSEEPEIEKTDYEGLRGAWTWNEMKDLPELSFICLICSSVASSSADESLSGCSACIYRGQTLELEISTVGTDL